VKFKDFAISLENSTVPPELKTEPKATGILMGEDYYDLYFSAALEVDKIMDEYFRQNLTVILLSPGVTRITVNLNDFCH
jgi:hypothetical protein